MDGLPPRRRTDVPGLFYRDFARRRIYYAVYRDPVTGRQREKACRDPKTREPLNKAQAKRYRARLIGGGTEPSLRSSRHERGETVADYYQRWRRTYRGRTAAGIHPDVFEIYCLHIERHVLPVFGKKPLAEFDAADLRELASRVVTYEDDPKRRAKGHTRAASTLRNILGAFRVMYATAVDEGAIPFHRLHSARVTPVEVHRSPSSEAVAAGAQLPSGGGETRALTEDQLVAVVAAVDSGYDLLVATIAGTGVRISEALGWLVEDFDPVRLLLRVRRTWRKVTVNGVRRGQYRSVKTKYGVRDMPLSVEHAARLVEHVRSLPEGHRVPLFPDPDGRPLDQDHLREVVLKPAVEAAGVPWAGFHTLRHTFASIQVRHGADLKRLQLLMGHHDPAYTQRAYVHLFQEDLPPPPEVFEKVILGSNGRWAPRPQRVQRSWTIDECRRAIAQAIVKAGTEKLTLKRYGEISRGRDDMPALSTIIRIASEHGESFAKLRDALLKRELEERERD